jgi:hypothetical protein
LTPERKAVLEKLKHPVNADSDGLMDIVIALLTIYTGLPDYTRTTLALPSAKVRAVRDALREAREPAALVFEDLPKAVGMDPWTGKSQPNRGWTTRFVRETTDAVKEIQTAYDKLLERSRDHLVGLLQLPRKTPEYRKRLRKEVRQIKRHGLDRGEKEFKAYLERLDDTAEMVTMEDRKWEEALFMTIAEKPPKRWSQVDEDRFRTNCEILARSQNLVRVAMDERGGQNDADCEMVSVSVARSSGKGPQSRAFRIENSSLGAITKLREQIQNVIGRNGNLKSGAEIALAYELEARIVQADRKKAERQRP